MLLRVSHVAPRASLATPSPSCGSPCDPCYFSSPCVTPLASPTISCPLLCVGSMCVSCYTFSPCSFSCVPCYFVSPATVPRVSPMAPPEAAESRILNPSFFFLFLFPSFSSPSSGSPCVYCYSVSLMWLPASPLLLRLPHVAPHGTHATSRPLVCLRLPRVPLQLLVCPLLLRVPRYLVSHLWLLGPWTPQTPPLPSFLLSPLGPKPALPTSVLLPI
jgi:hypothetical protein